MKYDHSELFDKQGYISVKDYLKDVYHMQKNGPWRLPFGIGDRIHLFFLSLVSKFSWFSDVLYIEHMFYT